MHRIKQLSVLSGLLFTASLAQASMIGSLEHAATHPWDWHAGAATSMNNGIYKDTKGYALIYPYVGYQGGRLTIAGPSGWLRLAGPKDFNVSFGGTLLPNSFDPTKSSNAQMRQLNKREFSVGAGLQGSLLLKSLGLFNVRLLRAFFGGNGGYYAEASYTTMFSKGLGDVSLSFIPSTGIQYYSNKLANYYYGISAVEASKSGLAAYTATADYQPFISAAVMGTVKGRYRAYVSTRMSYLPNSVANSPIIGKRYNFTTTLMLSMGL